MTPKQQLPNRNGEQGKSLPARRDAKYLAEITQLLTPSETGEGFHRHYFEALQKDPNVTWAHAEFIRLHRAVKS